MNRHEPGNKNHLQLCALDTSHAHLTLPRPSDSPKESLGDLFRKIQRSLDLGTKINGYLPNREWLVPQRCTSKRTEAQGKSLSIDLRVHMRSLWASLLAQMVGNLPAMQETWVQSLGWEDPLGEGMATHSTILTWRIPRGSWQATVHGITKICT